MDSKYEKQDLESKFKKKPSYTNARRLWLHCQKHSFTPPDEAHRIVVEHIQKEEDRYNKKKKEERENEQESYVKTWAEVIGKLQGEFAFMKKVDDYRTEHGCSIEDACRDLYIEKRRYHRIKAIKRIELTKKI